MARREALQNSSGSIPPIRSILAGDSIWATLRAMRSKPKTVDQYLAVLSDDHQAALARLRDSIRKIVPRAEECISYGLPAFRLDGRMLVWYGAAKHHCSFYPGGIVTAYQEELKGYEISKGTIRFQPEKPIPTALVRKLVKARIARTSIIEKRSPRQQSKLKPRRPRRK